MSEPQSCRAPHKRQHASRATAEGHLKALRRAGGSPDLNVYRCAEHWHVGHSQVSLTRRIRAALRR